MYTQCTEQTLCAPKKAMKNRRKACTQYMVHIRCTWMLRVSAKKKNLENLCVERSFRHWRCVRRKYARKVILNRIFCTVPQYPGPLLIIYAFLRPLFLISSSPVEWIFAASFFLCESFVSRLLFHCIVWSFVVATLIRTASKSLQFFCDHFFFALRSSLLLLFLFKSLYFIRRTRKNHL